ncbi:uncharacterized protein LOC101046040, partial [Saimiri boliviensis]|uniref:uncharacterized protein LOC101046040 n=1 Tax=Saimiri boliviensis TaxID=27679 RepID=UPI003D77BEEE
RGRSRGVIFPGTPIGLLRPVLCTSSLTKGETEAPSEVGRAGRTPGPAPGAVFRPPRRVGSSGFAWPRERDWRASWAVRLSRRQMTALPWMALLVPHQLHQPATPSSLQHPDLHALRGSVRGMRMSLDNPLYAEASWKLPCRKHARPQCP